MISSLRFKQLVLATSTVVVLQAVLSAAAVAQSSGVRFQRPGAGDAPSETVQKQFRRPSAAHTEATAPKTEPKPKPVVARKRKVQAKQQPTFARSGESKVAKRRATEAQAKPLRQAKVQPAVAERAAPKRQVRRVAVATDESELYQPSFEEALQLSSYGCDTCDGPCLCEAGCGCPEPTCGCAEPSCGICEPSCGVVEPGCGLAEPSCGCGQVDCGSCCALPGPDYWCFPICLPRFKDMSVWAGVQSWGSPSNVEENGFGFNQGINLSGRAPLAGLLFPQLSYQVGYQAVQSRFEGSNGAFEAGLDGDRSQQFVTAGLFRRVNTGVQFGVVWDYMNDDSLLSPGEGSLQQIRTEISLKSPQGREIGFMSAVGTETTPLDALTARTGGSVRHCSTVGTLETATKAVCGVELLTTVMACLAVTFTHRSMIVGH